MRRFASLALAATLLAGPASAFAEFTTPAELLAVVQAETRPQTFSVTAKGHVDQTWFAVWASGAAEGLKPELTEGKMKMSMTVDVVQGDMKVRVKGQAVIKDGQMYLKLDSVDGGYSDVFLSFKAMFGQKLWLQMPVDTSMMGMEMDPTMTGVHPAIDNADEMFTMTHTKYGSGNKYVLTLHPEYAQQFSDMFREAFGARAVGVSDDFFPFRDLAYDNADFTVKVDTNAKDEFQYSSFDLHWKAGNAELTMTGNGQRTAGPVYVETPKNAWTMSDLESHYNKLMGMPSMEDEMMMPENNDWMPADDSGSMMDEGSDFNSVDSSQEWWEPVPDAADSAECWNPDLDPLKKLELQRLGICPITKYNNRSFRN